MTLELAESLLLSEAVTPRAIARGLFLEVTQQMPLVQALLVTGAIDEPKIEEAIGRGSPEPLTTITPSLALVQRLPRGFCSRLLVVPIGIDPETGAIDIALVDARDEHAAREAAFFLRADLRIHRATVSAIRAAIELIHKADSTLVPSPNQGERTRTPIWGTPVVSVVPQPVAHAAPADMPIPLMRRSAPPMDHSPKDDSAVIELRTPASSSPRGSIRTPAPDTDRDPVFALRAPASMRRPIAIMVAETRIESAPPASVRTGAVTVPAPRQDSRHVAVTSPAPPRRMSPSIGMPALPLPDATPVLAAMDEANDRDAIIALLISGLRSAARRVAVMAVKRDSFVGWSCNAEFGDAREWRNVQVPSNVPSVLATAAAGTPYLGPLFRTDGHLGLLEFMKEASRDVAVTGVRVDMHPALVLLADDLADTALATKRMEQLGKTAGLALARIIRKPPALREAPK